MYICAVCVCTLNRICLTLYDIINYNDVTFALSSYEYGKNITFTGVLNFKNFLSLIYGGPNELQTLSNFPRTYSFFTAGTDLGH